MNKIHYPLGQFATKCGKSLAEFKTDMATCEDWSQVTCKNCLKKLYDKYF